MSVAKPAFLTLDDAIRAAWLADTELKASELATMMIDEQHGLVRKWMEPKLATYIQSLIRPKATADPRQQYLPGMETLAKPLTMMQRLPLKKGMRPLGGCTVTDLREVIYVLRKRALLRSEKRVEPQLEWLQDLANQMSPYSERFFKRGDPVTVERYCEMKAAGTPVPRVRSSEQRREEARKGLKRGRKPRKKPDVD